MSRDGHVRATFGALFVKARFAVFFFEEMEEVTAIATALLARATEAVEQYVCGLF